MSTIVCLKEGNALVLGTDSRCELEQDDQAVIVSDALEKIVELGPDTFIACTGWLAQIVYQERRAQELARELGRKRLLLPAVLQSNRRQKTPPWKSSSRSETRCSRSSIGPDILVLARALDRDSRPVLEQLVCSLSARSHAERVDEVLSGERPLAAFVLVGRSQGRLGFVSLQHSRFNGQIVLSQTDVSFEDARRIFVSSPADTLAKDPAIFAGEPVQVVQQILDAQKHSGRGGGPDQIVRINGAGAHWISRLTVARSSADVLAAANGNVTEARLAANGLGFDGSGNIIPKVAGPISFDTWGQMVVAAASITGGAGGHLATWTVGQVNLQNAPIIDGTRIVLAAIGDAHIAACNVGKLQAGTANFAGDVTFNSTGSVIVGPSAYFVVNGWIRGADAYIGGALGWYIQSYPFSLYCLDGAAEISAGGSTGKFNARGQSGWTGTTPVGGRPIFNGGICTGYV